MSDIDGYLLNGRIRIDNSQTKFLSIFLNTDINKDIFEYRCGSNIFFIIFRIGSRIKLDILLFVCSASMLYLFLLYSMLFKMFNRTFWGVYLETCNNEM
jgi:hypothetical protein